jgi:hypothetical protein
MAIQCSIKGCPNDKAWAIVSDKAVHRITFSKALADHAVKLSSLPYHVERVSIREGSKELQKGEVSSTGLYAIIDRRKGKILRVALHQTIAEILAADYKNRKVTEAFIIREREEVACAA